MEDDLKKNKKLQDDPKKNKKLEDDLKKIKNLFSIPYKFREKPFLGLAQLSKILLLYIVNLFQF
jgi:hypothetical protein